MLFVSLCCGNNAQLRTICQDRFAQIAKDFEIDLAEAKAVYAPRAAFDPKTVAMLYVSMLQRDATGKQPAKVGTASRN